MRIKYNGKKKTKKIIVHYRESPDSPSRQMSKMSHFKRKDTPEKDNIPYQSKPNSHHKNKQETIKTQFIQLKGLKFIRVVWNPT
jgi:hypothetical protein